MARRSEVLSSIERSSLIEPGATVLAMLSGGADSVCLLHALSELLGAERLRALHVNHGLRGAAFDDERFCTELCERLGIALYIERLDPPARGNVEAQAREGRYAAADRVRAQEELDLIATGHTATDQVETILYRLVSSPGRRALLGMRPRRGRLVRPLLAVTREETLAYCVQSGLSWREDESNEDRSLARNRLRHEVVPQLRLVHPAVEANVLATASELRDEAEVLELAVDRALEECGAGGDPPSVEGARLAELPAALRRLVLRLLAERAAAAPLPIGPREVAEIERLAAAGGSAQLDLGQGIRVVSEYGLLRFVPTAPAAALEPAELPVPGRCRFGSWEVACTLENRREPLSEMGSLDSPVLDAALLSPSLTVRSWSEGDRMRPLGVGGTKSLQDLFVDRKVPRSIRGALPVVVSDGEIAWVPGLAVSEAFKVTESTAITARLDAVAAVLG